jgi:hypothetical protein
MTSRNLKASSWKEQKVKERRDELSRVRVWSVEFEFGRILGKQQNLDRGACARLAGIIK